MTLNGAGSVISGVPYLIIDVAGRQPVRINEFVGDVDFTVVKDTQAVRVSGTGVRDGREVRFYQKDRGSGKDLRTWQVSATAEREFEARTISNY